MATYIVGDLQGCLDELRCLLKQAQFDPISDQLWIAGDLVARGPKSLETLRFVRSLGDAAKVVLGNHDLHLLAVSIGIHPPKKKDNILPILHAEDAQELLAWLRTQPLMAEHDEFLMSHAGISPQWDLVTARQAAKEVETILQSEQWRWLIENMYENQPDTWDCSLQDIARYRYIINTYTRMRYCFENGALDMECKLPPSENDNTTLIPWFLVPNRIPLDKTVLFGHWAALEGYHGQNVIGLDTGCVWGGELTMIRWEDKRYFVQPSLSTTLK